jgi:hypothetical protein
LDRVANRACLEIERSLLPALLRTFIEAGNIGQPGARYTETAILWQTPSHLTFIVSAIGIAAVDRLGQFAPGKRHKPSTEHA